MSNITSLKQDLKNLLQNYKSNVIVVEADLTNFFNLLTDYDSANDTSFSDNLYTDYEICTFEDLQEYKLRTFQDLQDLLTFFDSVDDPTATYFMTDWKGGVKNIYRDDLLDFIEEYIK